MNETMYDYIKETPFACKTILDNRKEITEGFVRKVVRHDIKRVVFIACGSSYNAATSARLFVGDKLQMPTKVITPFMFNNYERFFDKNDLLIMISESGRSTSTIDAVKKAYSEGLHFMVLTNNVNSPITKEGGEIINLSCGVETVGYVTKGYTSTVLSLMLMGLEGALSLKKISNEEYQSVIGDIEDSIRLMPDVINSATAWYQTNKANLLGSKRLMMVGYGPNFGTALEGSLKLQETIGLPSTAFELEEFMHGPNLELTEKHTVFFINTIGKAEKRMMDLIEYVSKITENCYLITHGKISGNPKALHIDHTVNEDVSPLFMAIPFQLLAHFITEDLGINLNDNEKLTEDIFKLSKVE